MVNRNLLRQYDPPEDEWERELEAAFPQVGLDWLPPEAQSFRDNEIVTGRVRRVTGDEVWIDVGYKSEGSIPLREWFDEATGEVVPPQPGESVEVLLEAVEDATGAVVLSYWKARRQRAWAAFTAQHKEGDVVSGPVTRKIKGGLLVNIGIPAFLPASQVDTRRTLDVGAYLGQTVECVILSIDHDRRNIIVSRRKLLEDRRAAQKQQILAEIAVGQVRPGVVRNLASFGAFIDLGGIDGLLHVTDMAWNRVSRPEDVVQLDQKLDVMVLKVDKQTEKISLGLKQLTPSPWSTVASKYPIGSRHTGEVVTVMPYGAFVRLEPGIEGLVHISEMSWTRRLGHPSEAVSVGDRIEVQVLNINQDKQEISLGLKQAQPNPWDQVAEKYPPGTQVEGTVRNLTNYGAFIEIEEGIDGLLHVSDMSWVRKISHPSDLLQKGDKVKCVVLEIDRERKRIALGLKQLASDPWEGDIPSRYRPGDIKTGKVTKLTNFGLFVELEPGLEGLLHVSEWSDPEGKGPAESVQVGDTIEVRVLRVDPAERKVGLGRKTAETEEPAAEQPDAARAGRPRERELRGGTSSNTGQLFSLPAKTEEG
jgi:small subunit ribosomal protein S1